MRRDGAAPHVMHMTPWRGRRTLVQLMARVRIGDVAGLASAHRHVLTLRHTRTEETHDVLLFRMASATPMFYCMEARCPHLGASLERAALRPGLDDVEDLIVVCPYVGAPGN